jgi:LysR family transcriptional regulator, nitrogen assimilation regulatory protein
MIVDLRQLRYFIAVVECRSFSRAAEQLHVAQPALSQHVIAMEKELGVTLLHRGARGILPTEEGARLLSGARFITSEFQYLGDFVRGESARPSGDVRFAMPPSVCEQIGVSLVEAVRRKYPQIRVCITEAMSGLVLGCLRQNLVDVALMYDVNDDKGLVMHHAFTEEIVLCSRCDSADLPRGSSITLASALRLPLVLPSPSHSFRSLIDIAAASIWKRAEPAIEIDSYRQIKRLIMQGMAFGILPRMTIDDEVRERKFQYWRIARPTLSRRVLLGYRADRPLSYASQLVAKLAWNILIDMVKSKKWVGAVIGNEQLELKRSPGYLTSSHSLETAAALAGSGNDTRGVSLTAS